jgi:hypothetical protein
VSVGFEFAEQMSGTYHTLEDPGTEHPLTLTIRANVRDVKRFVLDPTAEITGEIDAAGFADHRPLRGTLEINPFLKRRLVYDFRFPDNDDRDCRFHGEKEIEPTRLIATMTTLPGTIFVDDEETARAVVRFHIRADLIKMLRSFKPA